MRKKLVLGIALMVAMLCLTACPESSRTTQNDSAGDTFTNEATAEKDVSVDNDSMFAESQGDQKLVYSGSVTIGTDSIKKSYEKVIENMKTYGAFFESVNESSGCKTMYIRVPQKNYMKFYESLSGVDGTITYSNVNIEDKTKTYKDNTKRMEILQTEYNELKELMEKANSVEEILTIKERMTNVTYEIETLKGANDTIDYDADYGSLSLTLQLNGSHDEASFWHQIKEAFSGGFHLLKQLVLMAVYMWWAILIAAYIIYASNKKLWPFKVKKAKSSKQTESKEKTEEPKEEMK